MSDPIQLNDMEYGQGEWKNLQEVIRKTFKACFSDLKQHDAELSSLTDQMESLKQELNNRPTWNDLDKMVQLKLNPYLRKDLGMGSEQDLQQQLLQLRTEMEKKVSLSYFDMTLGKKMDRSDVLVRELSRFSLKDYQDDIKKLKLDQIHYQSQIDEILDNIRKQQIQTNICCSKFDDIAIMQALLESLQKSVYECPSKHFIETSLVDTVSKTELEIQLGRTADKGATEMAFENIEKTLRQHETLLTTLRLSQNDPTLFSEEYISANYPSSSSSSKPTKSSKPIVESAQDIIIPGMEASVVPVLWGKMNMLVKDNKKLRKQVQIVEEELKNVRESLTKAANVDKVELLGIIMEEQLQRIDAIIQGTAIIKPLQAEIRRIDEHLHSILEVLDLPESETISKRLNAINMTHHELKSKLVEVDSVVQQHIVGDLDSLHQQVNSLESRWATYLHDRDRIVHLMEHTNLTGTPYRDTKHLASNMEVIKKVIDAANTFETINIPPHQCHAARLNALENQLLKSSNEVEKVKYKMKQMKQVLVTLSMEAPIVQVERQVSSSASSNSEKQQHYHFSNKAEERKPDYNNKNPIIIPRPSEEYKQSTTPLPTDSSPASITSTTSSPLPPNTNSSGLLSSPEQMLFTTSSSPSAKQRISNYRDRIQNAPSDFENVLNEIFTSKATEELRSTKQLGDGDSPNNKSTISLTEVDIRLAELEKEKKRLRKLLVTNL